MVANLYCIDGVCVCLCACVFVCACVRACVRPRHYQDMGKIVVFYIKSMFNISSIS